MTYKWSDGQLVVADTNWSDGSRKIYLPGSAGDVTGSADLTATSSLTATAKKTAHGSAAVSATSALAASGTAAASGIPGNAQLSALSSVTAQAKKVAHGTASLSGTSTATADGEMVIPPGIHFAGSATGHTSSSSADFDISLPTLREDDIVVVVTGGSRGDWANCGVITEGYTEVADLYAKKTNTINLSVSWKRMGAVPDTTVTCYGPHTTYSDAMGIAYVLRGVDTSTALDVVTATATGEGDHDPDPPAITPITDGAYIVIAGGCSNYGASGGDDNVPVPSGYSNQVVVPSINTTNDSTIMVASKEWSGGTEDPPSWDVDVGNALADAWAAVTLALRPERAAKNIAPETGTLTLTGLAPEIAAPQFIDPEPGILLIFGLTATIITPTVLYPDPALLSLTGLTPTLGINMANHFSGFTPAMTGTFYDHHFSGLTPQMQGSFTFANNVEFSGVTPDMQGTWEFGDEISFDVETPGMQGSFEGGASFAGRTPFPHFTGTMEMQQYGSFSGLSAAMGFSGQGGAEFSGKSPIMQGGFTMELEQYGSFTGRTPDMHGSFTVEQAGTFSGLTPAMRVDFTGDMEQFGSFSGLTPAIRQYINRVDWEELNFSGFTPAMQFSGEIEEDPNITFSGDTPPITGNFYVSILDSTQVGDDTIIRHRRGYDRG